MNNFRVVVTTVVLIETLWNVNFVLKLADLSEVDINRNIVECKFWFHFFKHPVAAVLIETLWNVNVKQSIIFNDSETGINRNIVECKYTTCKATYRTDNVLIETLWNVNAFFRIHGASSPPY